MKLASGASLYTRIAFADVRTQEGLVLFPNPARNEVYISCSEPDQVSLFSMSGIKLKVNLEKINISQVKINTAFLKPGIYFVKAGDKQRHLLIQ